jgi:hypothetical protein
LTLKRHMLPWDSVPELVTPETDSGIP